LKLRCNGLITLNVLNFLYLQCFFHSWCLLTFYPFFISFLTTKKQQNAVTFFGLGSKIPFFVRIENYSVNQTNHFVRIQFHGEMHVLVKHKHTQYAWFKHMQFIPAKSDFISFCFLDVMLYIWIYRSLNLEIFGVNWFNSIVNKMNIFIDFNKMLIQICTKPHTKTG